MLFDFMLFYLKNNNTRLFQIFILVLCIFLSRVPRRICIMISVCWIYLGCLEKGSFSYITHLINWWRVKRKYILIHVSLTVSSLRKSVRHFHLSLYTPWWIPPLTTISKMGKGKKEMFSWYVMVVKLSNTSCDEFPCTESWIYVAFIPV